MRLRNLLSFFVFHLVVGAVLSCEKNEFVVDIEEETNGSYIVLVPDIQNYTDREDRFHYLDLISNWCILNVNAIDACLQVGDITNNNSIKQWGNAYNLFFSKIPPKIRPIICLGNHDYGINGSSNDRTSNVPDFLFPVKDIYDKNSKYENYVHFVDIGAEKYAILVLEISPRNSALDWANNVIKANPTTPFIILTHIFLNNDGQLFNSADPQCNQLYSQKQYSLGGDYKNDSFEIFSKIIFNNPNVKIVICGHCVSDNYVEYNTINNKFGNPVHLIMVNYQDYEDGGKGNIGLLRVKESHWTLRSYSTFYNKYGNLNVLFSVE